ncbi:MAG: hypothetical protein LBE49_01080, partial [Deltaproteobacteria bacterium]|jgi:uncharacterized membrane protein HdeD (DUF308 family)|nr:hypothetical protein [Deltaproteobacteria bacterium]
MSEMANILESAMMVTFGLAWPANILNSLRVKSSRGRTPVFLIIIIIGYMLGLTSKFFAPQGLNYVALFYSINLVMVSVDLSLYFRYRALDRRRGLG